MAERFGPRCPAGDKCEVRAFLDAYERVDQEHKRIVLGKNAELRLEVNRLEDELATFRNPEEERADGVMVRKDRWESGIRNIVGILFGHSHDFTVEEVVESVRKLADASKETAAERVAQSRSLKTRKKSAP